ncbi:hypothetical protein HG530_008472 [Fusarium avenaceum]|nr:hypothetical protein HG530_008472 [Fusarium avenaceum]
MDSLTRLRILESGILIQYLGHLLLNCGSLGSGFAILEAKTQQELAELLNRGVFKNNILTELVASQLHSLENLASHLNRLERVETQREEIHIIRWRFRERQGLNQKTRNELFQLRELHRLEVAFLHVLRVVCVVNDLLKDLVASLTNHTALVGAGVLAVPGKKLDHGLGDSCERVCRLVAELDSRPQSLDDIELRLAGPHLGGNNEDAKIRSASPKDNSFLHIFAGTD